MHPAASCCFLLFLYSGFPAIKSAPKIPGKIYKKISAIEASGITKGAEEGHPQLARREGGAAPPWAAPGTLLADWWVPGAPLRLYLALGVETPNTDLIFANSPLYRRRRRFNIGAD